MQISDNGLDNRISVPDCAGAVSVEGDGNVVNVDRRIAIANLTIAVSGDGCRIEIGRMRRAGSMKVVAKNGGALTIGELSTIESCYFLVDSAPIRIGRDCMISFDVSMRTTDAHGIYDLRSGDLLNAPAAIHIGDHIWIGQSVIIAKGVAIGPDSVIGARSYITGKTIPPNTVAAGSPARVLREGITWDRRMTANYLAEGADVDPFR